MKITHTRFPDLYVVEPDVFGDERGFFFESYQQKFFADAGVHALFVQDNQSFSRHGVIRGLHFQRNPHAQSKLVRVLEGVIFDVAVDLRNGSPTFGEWFGIELSAENKKQLYLPQGFAHGFSVLSEHASVLYKCDSYYHPPSEGGIRYNDPQLGIDWKVDAEHVVVSDKDKQLPELESANAGFIFTA
jgi:dTDP-4-dehydrorhamnose 3,5-epimerase